MLVDYAKNGTPTLRYHRWNRLLNPEDTWQSLPAAASEIARDIAAGVEQVAQTASTVISGVIDQITESGKAKRARKTTSRSTRKSTVRDESA
jgi:hypothetical protein